jgi:hypothetical protein
VAPVPGGAAIPHRPPPERGPPPGPSRSAVPITEPLSPREDDRRGARQKLNVAYIQIAVILAAALGALTGSWSVFGVALAALVAGALGDVKSRTRPRGR